MSQVIGLPKTVSWSAFVFHACLNALLVNATRTLEEDNCCCCCKQEQLFSLVILLAEKFVANQIAVLMCEGRERIAIVF